MMSENKKCDCKCDGEKQRVDRRVQTCRLTLTRTELEFLRDLMSVVMPQDPEYTMSQSLAKSCSAKLIERNLWDKIVEKCDEIGLPLGEEVPTFVVVPSGPPPMEVIPIEIFAGYGEGGDEEGEEGFDLGSDEDQFVSEAEDQ